jgi:hypothetical protein
MQSNIRDARRHIEALRAALLLPSPDPIEQCLPALEEAVRNLISVEQELRDAQSPGRPELRAELKSLETEMRIVKGLIANGAAFYQGWAKMLGAAAAGYTSAGQPAALQPPGSISLRG